MHLMATVSSSTCADVSVGSVERVAVERAVHAAHGPHAHFVFSGKKGVAAPADDIIEHVLPPLGKLRAPCLQPGELLAAAGERADGVGMAASREGLEDSVIFDFQKENWRATEIRD